MSGYIINPYIVSAAVSTVIAYLGQSYNASAQELDVQDAAYNNTGSKMFVIGKNSDTVGEYNLGTNFNPQTASYSGNNLSIAAQEGSVLSMFWKPAGDAFYIVGSGLTVYQYTVSTPFDITTASYASKSFSVGTQAANSHGIAFGDSGTKMYIADISSGIIYQYTLGVAWDVATASYASLSFSTGLGALAGIAFITDGSKMFGIDNITKDIIEYDLGTNWNISTLSATGYAFDVSSQSSNARDISLGDNDTKILYSAAVENTVFNYSLTL